MLSKLSVNCYPLSGDYTFHVTADSALLYAFTKSYHTTND